MELADLMREANATLAAQRAVEAEREAQRQAAVEAQRAEFCAVVERGIHDLLPEALWPYIDFGKPYAGRWDVPVKINVPECAEIACLYLPEYKQFNDNGFLVAQAHAGGMYYEELYAPFYEQDGTAEGDIYIALALAAEQHQKMQEYEAAYAAAEAQRAAAEAQRAAEAAAAPFPVEPKPTVAERLEGLMREIINDVLAASAADYY